MDLIRVVNEVCGFTIEEVNRAGHVIVIVHHYHVGCIGQPSVVGIEEHTHNCRAYNPGVKSTEKLIKTRKTHFYPC